MMTPRIEVDLSAVEHNSRELGRRLHKRGISITGLTHATLGSPEVAHAMIRGGIRRLGDTRVENIAALRDAGIRVPIMLVRSPAPEWADGAVASATHSFVSDLEVVTALSVAAGKRALTHGIVLMVELGDLSEGIMTADVLDAARIISRTRHVTLAGIGANLRSRSEVIPGDDHMQQLTGLATAISSKFGVGTPLISGGDSSSLTWALGNERVGSVNDVRLGEAILLGTDPLTGELISGLRGDAFTVVAPVIESLQKPSSAWGLRDQAPANAPSARRERGTTVQTIVALGTQDVDPAGLIPPVGYTVLASSSDHLILETPGRVAAGTEVSFGVNYAALTRAMTSPFVVERLLTAVPAD